MMQALRLEFFKSRRKYVWLAVAALIGVQLMWGLWSISRMDALDLETGWKYCLYQFPLINAIMMPAVAAVVASRLSDVEHKGQSLRLLETVMPAGRLFDAKFFCGAAYMLAAVVLQIGVIFCAGKLSGFAGAAPWDKFGLYFFCTLAVNLTLLVLQQALSLFFPNQMIALSVGVLGTFLGLFSMFFPVAVQKISPWGYYGVLMFVGMDWDRATRFTHFYWSSFDVLGAVLLAVFFGVFYGVGRRLFVKKEL